MKKLTMSWNEIGFEPRQDVLAVARGQCRFNPEADDAADDERDENSDVFTSSAPAAARTA
jgi:hypothetical protein